MYKYILLIVLMLTIFSGCNNLKLEDESEATLNNTNTENENTDTLFDENLEDNSLENNNEESKLYSDLEDAISNAIIENNIGRYTEGEYQTESHVNLLIDENDDVVTVYTMALYTEYTFKAKLLKNVSEGHYPVAITFLKKDSYYSLIEYWRPLGGNEYANSIRGRFPESTWDKALDTQQFIESQLKETEKKALDYFTKE
ncbi:hypothetical protein HZF24_03610 [Sedimentibacter hydroxybenzoicus DSM 7310]|uniref:Uncharacterized protein n=1 Tax=Sedimentibacter hydroxybenzoicus DSM 7310 TaxID=1123245 RepID=A0A974GVC8_SEDHY|nr:hypothetical protein [Sedimentibacter hydroxybenzoicus]NYB73221.1 hypothetical protein [Sedimentibacter hydroxybenzoicus DSM 7310]